MHPTLRRLAVLGLVSACGDTGGPVEPGPKMLAMQLAVTHHHELDGATFRGTWELVGKVAFDSGEAAGWIAITNLTADEQPHRDLPCTRAAAIPTDGPVQIILPGIDGSVTFDELAIEAKGGDEYAGHASGTFHQRQLDTIEDWTFSGPLRITLDETAPTAIASSSLSPIMADPQPFAFTEPVDLSAATITVAAGAGPVAVTTTPAIDPVSQLAIGATITPTGLWPDGEHLTASFTGLADAAANAGDATIAWDTPARPDSTTNLGFESGLAGWLGRTTGDAPTATGSVTIDDPNGAQVVNAPSGSAMAKLPAGSELAGFIVPPAGHTTLSLDVALINSGAVAPLQDAMRGVFVEIATTASHATVADGSDLPRPAAGAVWTGFHTLTITLPGDANTGFWLRIKAGGYEPPINDPRVLVDNIRL